MLCTLVSRPRPLTSNLSSLLACGPGQLLSATTGRSRLTASGKVIVTKELRGAEVELSFRTPERGGRSAPLLIEPGAYRPHFVAPGGECLGVVITRGPSEPVSPGCIGWRRSELPVRCQLQRPV